MTALPPMTLAQTTAPATSQTTTVPGNPTSKPAPGWAEALFGSSIVPIVVLFMVFYFVVIRSKKGQDRKRQDMLSQMKRGDRIQTIGGILGKVVDVEDSKVLVKVDESSNTKIWFSRSAIHRVVADDEKAEAK